MMNLLNLPGIASKSLELQCSARIFELNRNTGCLFVGMVSSNGRDRECNSSSVASVRLPISRSLTACMRSA